MIESKESKAVTINKTITIRKDVYKMLRDYRWNAKLDGFHDLRDSTLISLILEWALTKGIAKGMTEKNLLNLYFKANYARTPSRPQGLGWEKKMLEPRKQI